VLTFVHTHFLVTETAASMKGSGFCRRVGT
jgi:hypothetical protein